MKIFVTYKYEDLQAVQGIIEKFRELSPEIQVSIMRQSGCLAFLLQAA